MEKLVIAITVVVFGSALWSMIEAALFSVTLNRAKILREEKKLGSRSLVILKEKMHGVIAVIVIFNNIFNIMGSMIVGIIAVETFGKYWIGPISAIVTFLVIVFGEIFPKNIGTSYSIPISLFVARPILWMVKILSPLIWVINFFTKSFWSKSEKVSEEEIKMLSHLGCIEGSIETDEKEMIQKVFMLNDLTARDIMTPRTVVKALEADEILQDLKDMICSLSHSRLPVYNNNLDNIIGVCHQRDLLIVLGKGEGGKKIRNFVNKNYLLFVSEKTRLDELLPLFQKQKTHLAIVVDEFGGTAGVVTLEDVIEQIVGDIVDETDTEIDLRAKAKLIGGKRNRQKKDEQ